MRKYITFLASALVAVAASSCNPVDKTEAKLTATPESLYFAAEKATAQTITVTAEATEWKHELPETATWLTVTRKDNTLTVNAADNTEPTAREATITITPSASGVAPVKVAVTQVAATAPEVPSSITLSPETLNFVATNAPAQEVTVTTVGEFTWKIATMAGEEWIHITPPADGKFTVTLDDNTASTERRAYINVIPDDKTIVTQKLLVIQEPAEVEPVLELILPEGTDPEKGIIFDPAGGFIRFDLNVEPQTAEWTVSLSDENASEWLVVTPTVTPNAHSILLQAKPNSAETNRTTQLTFSHASENVAPVTITVTQKAKANVLSTIEEDIDVTMPQARIECKANNTTRDYPFIQWTLTLYEEGLTYNKIWGRWEGAGARIVIHMTGDPANEEDVELEARTYTVVPYEEYTKQPLVDRLPGWVCTGSSNGKSLYPSGTWYQTLSGGAVTGCANATEGTVTVTRNGDEYTISWDFVSDAGKQVKGSYTGPVNIIF